MIEFSFSKMENKPKSGDLMIVKNSQKIILTYYRLKKLFYNENKELQYRGIFSSLSSYSPWDYVDLKDERVQEALSFMKELIVFSLKNQPDWYIPSFYEEKPWAHYIPARDEEERKERDNLIEKYGRALPHQIQYYLRYHHCHAFSVLMWTVLQSNGIKAKIINQILPMNHTYLLIGKRKVIDVLFKYCEISYPYRPSSSRSFDTPHDFYEATFISSPDKRAVGERELLRRFRLLEK